MTSMLPESPHALHNSLQGVKSRVLTPALVIDLSAAAHNIGAMQRRISGTPALWRPHIKTVKQARVIRELLAAGIQRFKCATLPELRLLDALARDHAGHEPLDILWAYPTTAAARASLTNTPLHPNSRVSLLADSPTHLRDLARWSQESQRTWGVFLDVDVGMHRTGTPPAGWSAPELLAALPSNLTFRGLHGYDGHHRGTDRALAHDAYDSLVELARSLDLQRTHAVITSGTHSYEHALSHEPLGAGPWQQEVSPGTIVLSDLRSASAAEQLGLRQAVFVAARVVSVGAGRVTLDAGSKGLNPDVRPPHARLLGWPGLTLGTPSEEHLPATGPDDALPALGDMVWIVPAHACTTVNMYKDALYLVDGEYAGTGPVDAAGHPLWVEGTHE